MKKLGMLLVVFMLCIIILTGCVNNKKENDGKKDTSDDLTTNDEKSDDDEGPEGKTENITVSTDKETYDIGETVNISIKNNLNTSLKIRTPTYDVQKYNNTEWTLMRKSAYPCESSCVMGMILPNFTIDPNQTLEYQWDQKETWCIYSESSPCQSKTVTINATTGIYRIKCYIENNDTIYYVYSDEFTII